MQLKVALSHTRTMKSALPEKMSEPVIATHLTSAVWPLNTVMVEQVSGDHTLTHLSLPPLTITFSSTGIIDVSATMQFTPSVCPLIMCIRLRELSSHTWILPFSKPLYNVTSPKLVTSITMHSTGASWTRVPPTVDRVDINNPGHRINKKKNGRHWVRLIMEGR
jgi:hypothetical protein